MLILYRPKSEHASLVDSFVRDFQHQHEAVSKDLELLSVDTREGSEKAQMYDILAFPAILVTSNDGSVLNIWAGLPLPLMSEVAGYAYSG